MLHGIRDLYKYVLITAWRRPNLFLLSILIQGKTDPIHRQHMKRKGVIMLPDLQVRRSVLRFHSQSRNILIGYHGIHCDRKRVVYETIRQEMLEKLPDKRTRSGRYTLITAREGTFA